jgi:hypothetical protein
MSRLALIAAIQVVLFGCSPAPPVGLLTDPHEILATSIRTTAALSYTRIHLDMRISSVVGDAPAGAGDFQMALDLDLDVRHGQWLGRITRKGPAGLAQNGPPGQRTDVQEIIATVNASYVRNAGAARWTKAGAPGSGPTSAGFASIEALLSNPGVKLELGEPAACSLGTCYHVVATAPGDVAVKAIGAALGSGDGSNNEVVMPPLTFDVLVDQSTGLMSEVRFSATVQGTTNQVALLFSNPDLVVQIVAPPPGLTDDLDVNIGGGFGGGGVEPAPTPIGIQSPSP